MSLTNRHCIKAMACTDCALSLWRRDATFDHSLPFGDTLTRVVRDIFSKYSNVSNGETESSVINGSVESAGHLGSLKGRTVASMEEGSVHCEYGSQGENNQHVYDISMSSEYSFGDTPNNPPMVIHFENSDSEESMSIPNSDVTYYEDDYDYHNDKDDHTPMSGQTQPSPWRVTKWTTEDIERENVTEAVEGSRTSRSNRRCMRCEAYDAHCKSAAENYRRTLTRYTKTVSELMIGFKKVLERYPELRVDSSDQHLHYMVQAALGRNNLIQEMVRLAAKRTLREAADTEPEQDEAKCYHAIDSIHEALNTCYTDGEALRMILQRYTNLYVRYIEVWREMCAKVSREITVMEFMNMTQDRPGVSHGEPWSEAKAYIARILHKVSSITPRAVGDACTRALNNIAFHLSTTPTNFDKRKVVLNAEIEDIRNRLDRSSRQWSWDSCLNDLYFDIRSDLTVLEALVGVGEISVKTLLYERSVLISQVRKLTRNQGFLELQVTETRSKLRDTVTRCRYAEMNAL